ncbi:glycoside hydrolase family 12 protein [Desarmillaria tabescens]|uniref:Glycoside hydrolase family 12 protein n=1 Tax=Armillaria tabescens TaxID=1929756 RepID=A0AA39KAG3_ARMTA|nr:glycoside hydrolase family 12 protein [Desarmillaria tabescens]KAK0455173.1 glycoside hydrolase family 12 protein [Desarmillaria tabescens]
MFFRAFSILAIVAFASVLASPIPDQETKALAKRGSVLSGQWDTESEAGGRFILENNLWGMSAATSGSQTSQVTATNGNTTTWHTTYTWQGGNFNVKSFANLDLRVGLGKTISSISSIPVTWTWSYSSASSGLVADVSYDLWLSNVASSGGASSTSTFEVMIWLSTRGGAGPAGSQIGTATINGITWKLFQGTVSTWTVYSFVAPSEITNFKSDLKPFLTYLTSNRGVPSSQFLVQAQGGTEPFIGSATFSTSAYAISIN